MQAEGYAMTGNLTMYDSPYNSQFPPGGDAYAAYVDGSVGDQPNYQYIVSAFPHASHLSIAVFASDDADCLDVEYRAATPSDVPGWHARQKARGAVRPCVYASVDAMEAQVLPVITGAHIARSAVRLWTAHYGAGEHICGPRSCGRLSLEADGTQWADTAGGRTADQSLLAADFFGAPAPRTAEVDVQLQVLKQGDSGQVVRNWQGLLVAHGYGFMIAPGVFSHGSIEATAGVDGDFGAKTRAATVKLQSDLKITGDPAGTVGAATWARVLA